MCRSLRVSLYDGGGGWGWVCYAPLFGWGGACRFLLTQHLQPCLLFYIMLVLSVDGGRRDCHLLFIAMPSALVLLPPRAGLAGIFFAKEKKWKLSL